MQAGAWRPDTTPSLTPDDSAWRRTVGAPPGAGAQRFGMVRELSILTARAWVMVLAQPISLSSLVANRWS
jgi:hypothetical protein